MRYIVKQGRFGAYFYDTIDNHELDLNDVLKLLNDKENQDDNIVDTKREIS